jgi:hypothetical protein
MNPATVKLLRRIVAATAVCLAIAGCGVNDIDAVYGKRRGSPGGDSVNGTAVLAGMFENAGYRTASWRRLSPKLEQFNVVVWTPDSFELPGDEQREALESWLARDPGRTLVYVGRDYDAAVAYWRDVLPRTPAPQVMEVMRRQATAQARFDSESAAAEIDQCCDWFTLKGTGKRTVVRELLGPWSDGISAAKAEIEIGMRFDRPDSKQVEKWYENRVFTGEKPKFERLLACRDATLVERLALPEWGGSQILLIPNGSFLLNLPLVNHEHRKLAGKLVAACGTPGKVMFLESESGHPPVLDTDPDTKAPTGFEVFTVWPFGIVAIHLVLLGITACFALYPIFGRPRQPNEESLSDFGKHVEAMGELLEATGDREYAVGRLQEYHAHVRREPVPGSRSR